MHEATIKEPSTGILSFISTIGDGPIIAITIDVARRKHEYVKSIMDTLISLIPANANLIPIHKRVFWKIFFFWSQQLFALLISRKIAFFA